MNVRKILRLFTYLSLLMGILASLSCFSFAYIFYGLAACLTGTIIAICVLFARVKLMLPIPWNHLLIVALVLNSVPVFYLMFLIFTSKN